MTVYRLGEIVPELAAGCWIAATATVIGNVRMGQNASVWFGATIRGDNEPMLIGEGTNIQDNAVLHSDPGSPLSIGRDCTIGHQAIVHGCTIGDNTLVGMGAVVLNRAVVGRNCLIGAGTVIAEGKIIPDGSLVLGTPGRIVRELTEKDIDRIARTARHYVENARRFAAELVALS